MEHFELMLLASWTWIESLVVKSKNATRTRMKALSLRRNTCRLWNNLLLTDIPDMSPFLSKFRVIGKLIVRQ